MLFTYSSVLLSFKMWPLYNRCLFSITCLLLTGLDFQLSQKILCISSHLNLNFPTFLLPTDLLSFFFFCGEAFNLMPQQFQPFPFNICYMITGFTWYPWLSCFHNFITVMWRIKSSSLNPERKKVTTSHCLPVYLFLCLNYSSFIHFRHITFHTVYSLFVPVWHPSRCLTRICICFMDQYKRNLRLGYNNA
jgi:hypothetical protein